MSEKQTKSKLAKLPIENKTTLFIIGGVIGLAIFILILILVIIFSNSSLPVSTEEYTELTTEEKLERNQEISQDIYNSATDNLNTTNTNPNPETVLENFTHAIDEAKTTIDANLARIATMRYLNLIGDYEQVIKLGEQVNDGNGACEYPELDLDSRIICHNVIGIAYQETGNDEQSKHHMDALTPLIEERMKIENNEN